MTNTVPVDYDACLAGVDEDIHDLTEQVRDLVERVAALEARGQ